MRILDGLSEEDEFTEALVWALPCLKRKKSVGVLPLRHKVTDVEDFMMRLEVSGPRREIILSKSEEESLTEQPSNRGWNVAGIKHNRRHDGTELIDVS